MTELAIRAPLPESVVTQHVRRFIEQQTAELATGGTEGIRELLDSARLQALIDNVNEVFASDIVQSSKKLDEYYAQQIVEQITVTALNTALEEILLYGDIGAELLDILRHAPFSGKTIREQRDRWFNQAIDSQDPSIAGYYGKQRDTIVKNFSLIAGHYGLANASVSVEQQLLNLVVSAKTDHERIDRIAFVAAQIYGVKVEIQQNPSVIETTTARARHTAGRIAKAGSSAAKETAGKFGENRDKFVIVGTIGTLTTAMVLTGPAAQAETYSSYSHSQIVQGPDAPGILKPTAVQIEAVAAPTIVPVGPASETMPAQPVEVTTDGQAVTKIEVITAESTPAPAERIVVVDVATADVEQSVILVPVTQPEQIATSELSPQEKIQEFIVSGNIAAASTNILETYGTSEPAPENPQLRHYIRIALAEFTQRLTNEVTDAAEAQDLRTILAYLNAGLNDPGLFDNLPSEVKDDELATIMASGDLGLLKITAGTILETLQLSENGAFTGYTDAEQKSIATLWAKLKLGLMTADEYTAAVAAIQPPAPEVAPPVAPPAAEATPVPTPEVGPVDPNALLQQAIDRAIEQGLNSEQGSLLKLLIANGANLVSGSAMIGNCDSESNCDPTAEEELSAEDAEKRRPGLGLFQETDPELGVPGRRTALENAAAAAGVAVTDLAFQAKYTIDESKDRTLRGDSTKNEWEEFSKITDPAAATDFFRWHFERPNDHLAHADRRVKVAVEVYNIVNQQLIQITAENAAAIEAETARVAAETEAARIAAEAEAARIAAEAETARINAEAEAARIAEESEGGLSGLEIQDAFEEKYGGVSGNLEPSELTTLDLTNKKGEKIQLQNDAAAAFVKLNQAFKEHFGHDIGVNDDYRSYDEQVKMKEELPGLAAVAGKSNHGYGTAIDLQVNGFGSDVYKWLQEHPEFGWVSPEWAQSDGVKPEPWHFEYKGKHFLVEAA